MVDLTEISFITILITLFNISYIPFQLLYDFVLSHEDSTGNFLLSTNYPRKTFPLLNNENMNLEELGIKSNIAIFVQNMDEDSSDDE